MPTVLVIDDQEAVRLSLRISLEAAGYEVREAADGDAAMVIIQADPIHAVVTDLWMPGMDGVQFLRELRRLRHAALVIAITGGGPGMTIGAAGALAKTWGADELLMKPFDNRILVQELNRSLLPA